MRLIVLVNIIFGILEDSVITTITTRLHLPEPPRTPIIRNRQSATSSSIIIMILRTHLADTTTMGGDRFFL